MALVRGSGRNAICLSGIATEVAVRGTTPKNLAAEGSDASAERIRQTEITTNEFEYKQRGSNFANCDPRSCNKTNSKTKGRN